MSDLITNPRGSVQNQDDGVLDASLTASATSATISPVKKWINGVLTTGGFNTTAGFVKIIDSTGRYEFASFGSKSVSAANITTISDMRRGLPVTASSYTAGTGQQWDANTRIYVCDYATMWQDLVDTNNAQSISAKKTFTAGTRHFPFADTAARDVAFPSPVDGDECFVTGVGKQVYNGGWVTTNAATNAVMTSTTTGTGELGVIADFQNATGNGDSGSPVVAPTSLFKTGSAGAGDAYKPIIRDSAGRVATSDLGSGSASASTILYGNQTWGNIAAGYYFGSGADGAATISVNTTLSSDKHYTDLTINTGVVLNPAGYRVFISGTLTLTGTGKIASIGGNGSNGTNGSAQTAGTGGAGGTAAHAAGTLPASLAGKAGGNGGDGVTVNYSTGAVGTAGTAGTAATIGILGNSVAGVAGGTGGTGDAPGAAGGAAGASATTSITTADIFYNLANPMWSWVTPQTFTGAASNGGSGGGGGGRQGGSSTNSGGGGGGAGSGANGGHMNVFAAIITGSGTIEATGGNGGTGGTGGNGVGSSTGGGGGGGGGSAGNGGTIILVYRTKTGWSGAATAAAGSVGTGGSGGTGSGGGTGSSGASGNVGNAGRVLEYQIV